VVLAASAGVVAQEGTDATSPTSLASRRALKIDHAALDDLDTPAVDIAFLSSFYETERQDDFDRANPVAYAAYTGSPYQESRTRTRTRTSVTVCM
jgi:hypothetical protein